MGTKQRLQRKDKKKDGESRACVCLWGLFRGIASNDGIEEVKKEALESSWREKVE